ncbi:MAG: hypothetical protein K2V38_00315, partial [Gemmataceae bacterium]|nr:hypothetical protein [Gemmataceae bacterium]
MSDAPVPPNPSPKLFLRSQQLSLLTATDPEVIRALVCGTDDVRMAGGERPADQELWRAIARGPSVNRDSVFARAAAAGPGSRFGLVCEAGLGK